MTVFPWQREIIEGMYGNDRKARQAVISVARKNGKTALIAALAVAHLCGTLKEQGNEIICAASDKNQAGLLFRQCASYIQRVPALAQQCNIKRHEKQIEHLETYSVLKSVSSDIGKQHGHNASLVVMDEVAQWRNRELYDVLTTSGGARKHSLAIAISTQSADPLSLMSEITDYVLANQDDEHMYGYIAMADIEADPWDQAYLETSQPRAGDNPKRGRIECVCKARQTHSCQDRKVQKSLFEYENRR